MHDADYISRMSNSAAVEIVALAFFSGLPHAELRAPEGAGHEHRETTSAPATTMAYLVVELGFWLNSSEIPARTSVVSLKFIA